MQNLVRYDNDGLELIIDESTGEVFASISGYARMAGKSQQAISKRITHNQIVLKSAEVQTTTGFKTHNLVDETLMYEWLAKDNPELLVQCAKAGLRVYLYGLAGYEVKPTKSHKLPETFAEALQLAADQAKAIELQEAELQLLEQENEALAEAVDELFEYSSIIRIALFNKCSEKAFNWRKLKAASITLKKDIKHVPCPRFGTKNLYSHDVWRYVYPDYQLPETTTLRLPESN